MPSPGSSAETAAIDAAYEAEIQMLFKVLVTNIIDDGSGEKALAKFATGLKVARQARELALSAVGPAAPAVAMMSRSKRAKVK